jgi:UrcA family protein
MAKVVARVAVGLFAAALASSVVVAQQTEEVSVQASRIFAKQAGRDPAGIPIMNISLSYGVSYAGLDLVSSAGVVELEKRVNDAALKACEEINHQYPVSVESNTKCAKEAVDKAMVKVHDLVAAANQASKVAG